MTVSTTANKIVYAGNGATTVFPFTFPGVAASDLQVYYTDAAGNQTLLASNQYTVILNAPAGANPTGAGGSITYNPLGGPIALGTLLTIIRILPETQNASLANQGTLYQQVIESALDYLTMITQQLQELFGRGITVAVSDPAPLPLPPVAQRALQLMGFDAAGNPIASQPSSALVSTAMQPVVAAATLALARAAMGLGNIATNNANYGLQTGVSAANNLDVNLPVNVVGASRAGLQSDHATHLVSGGNVTISLLRANTLWNGFFFFAHAGVNTLSLTPNAADSIETIVAGVAYTLRPGQSALVVTDAANSGTWYIMQMPRFLANPTVTLSSTYTIKQSDNGTIFSLLGASYYTINAPAAASLSPPFRVKLFNNDTRGKLISPSGVAAFILWPGQSTDLILNDTATAWLVTPNARWRAPNGTNFYVDPTNGSDSNDGLASGTGAFATIAGAVNVVKTNYDSANGGAVINLADNATHNVGAGINLNYQVPGPNQNFITGNVNNNGLNCIVNCSAGGSCFAARDGVGTWTVTGVSFQTVGNSSSAINCSQYFQLDVGACIFGAFPLGSHISVADLGSVDITGNYIVTGNFSTHLTSTGNSHVNYGTFTCTVQNALTFTLWVACTAEGFINAGGVPFVFNGVGSGAGSVGKKYAASTGGNIASSGTVYPGATAGTVDAATFSQYS